MMYCELFSTSTLQNRKMYFQFVWVKPFNKHAVVTFCLSGDLALQPRPLACFSSDLAVWPIRVPHGERSTNEDARCFRGLEFAGRAALLFVVHQMAEFLGWLPGVTQKTSEIHVHASCTDSVHCVFVCDS